jgi:TolB-like protein/DNA-binding winged helix-turn-helix (wHTH) protein/cytochrome c-type biogenesis protein CcmH/NrfG
MPAEETSSAVQIGEWIAHPALDCISRGTETQKLEPRAMRLLLCLAESAGAVVSVDRLLAEVWTDVVVGSASVYQAVSQLRKNLGDVDPNPTYIVTVPRKGYRLIAPVQRVSAPVHTTQAPVMLLRTATPRRSWVVAGAFVALALAAAYFMGDKVWLLKEITVRGELPAEKSIAVLPFADMSEKMDQEYFSDGLAEELIAQLANAPGLKVIARTSSFSFKGKSDDIPTIAAKLNVANLLEGSVRRSGNHLRVSTQLIRADSGQRLWSETFDREFKDVFTIQDEIAAAVVTALKVQLNGGSTAARGHGTTNPEAYNVYLLGRQLYTQRTIPTSRQAIEAYQNAIELDPHYADAYADLAMSQYFLADNTGDVALGRLAEQTAQKSIDLDPHLSTGYSVRGFLRYLHHYDWVGAESDFRRALALEPTNSRVLSRYGKLLTDLGRTEEATAMLRKAIEQDPLSTGNWQNLGIALAESKDHAAAYDAFHHALAIRPGDAYTTFALGTLQLIDGKAQEALATFLSNSMEEFRGAGVAMAEQTLGDAKASQQALDKLIATSAGDAAYQIAEVYGWRGEKDKAFEWLERAYRQQDGGITDIKNDLRLASLRSDPRYGAMLQRLKFPP